MRLREQQMAEGIHKGRSIVEVTAGLRYESMLDKGEKSNGGFRVVCWIGPGSVALLVHEKLSKLKGGTSMSYRTLLEMSRGARWLKVLGIWLLGVCMVVAGGLSARAEAQSWKAEWEKTVKAAEKKERSLSTYLGEPGKRPLSNSRRRIRRSR